MDFFVQISCPRLSVDWGASFCKPLLNPYEFFVAMKKTDWKAIYPMDNYSNNGDMWTNFYHKNRGKGNYYFICVLQKIILTEMMQSVWR